MPTYEVSNTVLVESKHLIHSGSYHIIPTMTLVPTLLPSRPYPLLALVTGSLPGMTS